jgi:hypothetical protein
MHYKNTVGRFLHPDLGKQKLVAQKTILCKKDGKKCILEINLGNPKRRL